MTIEEMAHIIRAAKQLTGKTVFIVVGSTAVLAHHFKNLPDFMIRSIEVDLYSKSSPELSILIEGNLGKDSPFHKTFGYHADAISENTAILPEKWRTRANKLQDHPLLDGAIAICPEIHDLAFSKLAAFRGKDREWVAIGMKEGIIDPTRLAVLIKEPQNSFPLTDPVLGWLKGQTDDHTDEPSYP